MIHGYHVILTTYGNWLPNDPRGSWSDFVGRWELVQFGRTRRTFDKLSLSELSPTDLKLRDAARKALHYMPVTLDKRQTQSIATGFATAVRKSNYTIWACSIMPQHTHLVISRHTYRVEQIATLLKGAGTRQIIDDGCHPMAALERDGKLPSIWATGCWKVYLDTEDAILNALRYVENNPVEEGKPKQCWPFIKPFEGLDPGWIAYH